MTGLWVQIGEEFLKVKEITSEFHVVCYVYSILCIIYNFSDVEGRERKRACVVF
jgi:hypothetical protein